MGCAGPARSAGYDLPLPSEVLRIERPEIWDFGVSCGVGMAKWTFSTKWPTLALWKAHQAEKERARHHKRKREGKPAAAQEVTSLSGELKQAKATIAG